MVFQKSPLLQTLLGALCVAPRSLIVAATADRSVPVLLGTWNGEATRNELCNRQYSTTLSRRFITFSGLADTNTMHLMYALGCIHDDSRTGVTRERERECAGATPGLPRLLRPRKRIATRRRHVLHLPCLNLREERDLIRSNHSAALWTATELQVDPVRLVTALL